MVKENDNIVERDGGVNGTNVDVALTTPQRVDRLDTIQLKLDICIMNNLNLLIRVGDEGRFFIECSYY